MTPPFSTFVTALALMILCSCSSTKKTADSESKSSGNKKLAERLSIKEWDVKHRSSFEKQAQTAGNTNKTIKEGAFHTKDYTATKSATGLDKKYREKEFAQAGKTDQSKPLEKSYSGAKKTSQLGSEQFKTSESHLGDEKNQFTGKTFSGGTQVFRTGEDNAGAKAIKKNAMPKMMDPGKPSYSEDEVRSLLNKG